MPVCGWKRGLGGCGGEGTKQGSSGAFCGCAGQCAVGGVVLGLVLPSPGPAGPQDRKWLSELHAGKDMQGESKYVQAGKMKSGEIIHKI